MTLVGTTQNLFSIPAQGPQPKFVYAPAFTGYEKRYVAMSQNASLGRSMGPLKDLSGNGWPDLTGVNPPTMRLDGPRYYAELDGVDDYINAAGSATQTARTVYTVQRVRSLPASPRFLWLISSSQLVLYVNPADNQLFVRNLTNSTNHATGLFITLGKWHVFSLLNNGNTVLVSVDGKEWQATLTGLTGNTGVTNVGATSAAPNNGSVDFLEWIMWAQAQGYASRQLVVSAMKSGWAL